MEDPAKNTGVSTTSANGVEAAHPPDLSSVKAEEAPARAKEEAEKPPLRRTPGLKAFDVFLYPLLTNFGVFAMSVAATYLTTRGGDRNAAGQLTYGKIGKFFHERGEWLARKFKGAGMTESQADMSKMVAFSFIDGSLMAPVIKLFEDRREHIGRAIDKKLGTLPADESVYDAEPKQSWLSVLGGRLATVSIVVPTAVALDKTGLNDRLFNEPGKKLGERMAGSAKLAKWLGKLDVKELGRIGLFEAFYTSVCTAGIYISSRMIARRVNKNTPDENEIPATPPASAATEPKDESARNFSAGMPVAKYQDSCGCKKKSVVPAASFAARLDAEPAMEHSRV